MCFVKCKLLLKCEELLLQLDPTLDSKNPVTIPPSLSTKSISYAWAFVPGRATIHRLRQGRIGERALYLGGHLLYASLGQFCCLGVIINSASFQFQNCPRLYNMVTLFINHNKELACYPEGNGMECFKQMRDIRYKFKTITKTAMKVMDWRRASHVAEKTKERPWQ